MVLPSLVAHAADPGSSNAAFQVWSQTNLATERLTSAVELYTPDGSLVSRFALNLPEYAANAQKWQEQSCQWAIFDEVSRFGSEERRLLHAGRRLCDESGAPSPASATPEQGEALTGGSVVVHAMLDYNALSFIPSRSPYSEVIRPGLEPAQEDSSERDLQFVVYGWGRRPLYTSTGTAWPLSEELLATIALSRRPFWTTMTEGNIRYETYILNDRPGIYVLGYPGLTSLDHLINLAELTILGATGYVLLLAAAGLLALIGGRTASTGRELLREVRASFYRKLFLAFLAASFVPVVILAFVTRTFFAAQLRAGIESDAVRTAAVAQRVVEEYVALQQGVGAAATPDDDIMDSLSHAINQDVNIFSGPRLLATSVRDLFESGLLPVRTPNSVYRAIAIDRVSSFVGDEVAGDIPYTLAATPVRVGEGEAILTVPLALRQQEIEREIDRLDRRVVLAALLFVLLGGIIGYSMAERIGDPVNRLTRATRRIARGDLSARIVLTSSDELRRLVEDFNRMAADLQRQRTELERTHRLEAWAEMARQVAHEIKNPLTPIQLSSEHLMRVHKDRGEPLSPILEECMTAILSQVKLLRQISAEFSSFASSPTPHPVPTSLPELIAGVIEPYRTGLSARTSIETHIPGSLPMLLVDRTLLSRALTNIIENALHAMPGGGTLMIAARAEGSDVQLAVTDTGSGMDEEALRRIFEPYFSTKAAGTGLGLTIAKRNVEIQGGTIAVRSTPGQGTTVTIELPVTS
jgi:signal transduction histidine kinase